MAYSKDASTANGPVRKKLKTTDLPLPSATRVAIEGLAHTFKKKGGYDSLRGQVWKDLENSEFEKEITQSILQVAEDELEKSTETLLKLDRGKAALLLEGAVDRAGVYQAAEARIDTLIDAHIEEIESGIRALRREDIGVEAAAIEQARGGKTDEQYAEEAAQKAAAREKIREEAREKERAILDERRKFEKARRREEEKKIEVEQERRREEREAKKKADREREEKELRERERDRDRERETRDSYRERDRDRDRERDRDRDRDRDDRRRRYDDETRPSRHSRDDRDRRDDRRDDRDDRKDDRKDDRRDSRRDSVSKPELSEDESKRIEQEALDDLLKESQRVARRSRHQLELEVDKSLAPPPRKTMPASAIMPISRESTAKTTEVKRSTTAGFSTKDDAMKKPSTPTIPTGPKTDDLKSLISPAPISSSTIKDKTEEGIFKTPVSTAKLLDGDKEKVDRKSHRSRSRSRDRASTRRSSRSRSRRRRDSRERESIRPRKDSRDREKRRDSRERDDRRRKPSRDRDRDRSRDRDRDRRRSYRSRSRSRSRSRKRRDRDRARTPPHFRDAATIEADKQAEVKKREQQAREYLAAQQEAREKGLPIPGWTDREKRITASPTTMRKRDSSRDRDRDRERPSRVRSRSRTPTRRGSRIERSTSPVNIDRYVPGASARRGSRSPARKRDRSRDRDRAREKVPRDEDKPRRKSRSRSRSRRRDRSRERERAKARSRSRSPYVRKERRDRSRSRDRDRDRERRRDRSRDRSRDRGDRDRDRDRDRERKRSRSRGSRRESRRD